MSKPSFQQQESFGSDSASSSSRRGSAASEHGASIHENTHDAVRGFVDQYNLTSWTEIFRKASIVLQGDLSLDRVDGLTYTEIEALQDEAERKWQQPKMLYFTILICSIAAIEQGWAQTGMNGANLTFPKAFGIDSDSKHDNFVVGFINSGIYLGAGLMGAWLSDPINNQLGRRGAIFVGGMFCLLSNLGSTISANWPQLLLFRLTLGIGLGINASTTSVFAAECAPERIRGGLAVSWQLWTAFGIFVGFVTNVAVYNLDVETWRWQLAGPFIPTIPLLMMVYLCPESPSFMIKHGSRYDHAFRSLCKLRNTPLQAAKEVYSAYIQQRARSKLPTVETSLPAKALELFTTPRIRRATTASYVVMLAQQLCGINIIAFYSSTIFSDAGFSTFGALLASCIFGFVNCLGAFPAIWTMDTWGRRYLLLLTLPLMAITMFAAGLSFRIPADNPAHLGFLAALIYLFCALYSPGMGPVPSTYSAEVFPLSHRVVGMSFAVATANFWATIVSLTFPRLLTALKADGAFALYAVLNILAVTLVFLFVPETRLKTLDELDDVFSVSTRRFVKYQVTECIPFVVSRYLLRDREADLKPLTLTREYHELDQEDEEASEEI
ncbi:uncharacterized protein A1O9_00609 [Exophiala aquamarina CBS 119918]|uniref:Major facilitator superfamily (MFS) profile domain-containing protein n=1 Tax=Exophiala aquamarina CBS 119918 TaxID=1182545 RepID=A0A072PRY8_9EURO|nr:uncharacterized protein A1O9_00609 [Exophiala aquamarina CBS 119918]KEF62636.1 hypothetical protein A1O9_00609 [Exophiala aquamarina CBS 119918]